MTFRSCCVLPAAAAHFMYWPPDSFRCSNPRYPSWTASTKPTDSSATSPGTGCTMSCAAFFELHHGKRVLVVIDQFEDLLDLPDDAVREFADALAGQRPPADVATLATLRADFVQQVQADERIRSLVSTTFDSLLPMGGEQLHEAIAKPVEQVPGVRFEDGLVERILADTGSDPRVLPLLAFTLDRLGRATRRRVDLPGLPCARRRPRRARCLRWSGLGRRRRRGQACGPASAGAAGALLIGAEEATRRIVPRADLGDAEWRVAQRLAGARLIILNTAHDADLADALARVDSIRLSTRSADHRLAGARAGH